MQLESFIENLRDTLPSRWRVELTERQSSVDDRRADAIVRLSPPNGSPGALLVETKSRLSARAASILASALPPAYEETGIAGAIVFTRFASRLARERLRSAGISYLDMTGNVWISIDRPAVYIEREGAETDPDPPRRGVRSLKGAKAARIVRGLCDWRPPLGVRELARRAGTSAGYATRVLSLLEDEDVVLRDDQGTVTNVVWEDLLRRWSMDYSVTETNRALPYLAPRGLPELRERLTGFDDRYAVTGQLAVPPEAEVVPGRILSCYVESPELAARELDVRPTDSGANVLLLEPFDELVFERSRTVQGLTAVAPSQCVVDLLTGSGRDPAQADALLAWMAENENAWRT